MQCLSAVATIFLVFHVQATWVEGHKFLIFLLEKFLRRARKDTDHDQSQETRVEDALWHLRVKNYANMSRALVHVAAAGLLGLLLELGQEPGLSACARVLICCIAYVQHMVAGYSLVDMTPKRLNGVCWMLHVMLVLFMLASAFAGESAFAVMQGLQVSIRFGLIFLFINSHVSVPFQFLFTAVELWIFSCIRGNIDATVVLAQLFTLTMSLSSSIFTEMAVRSRLQALHESADAESLISGFRRMLRGICDGEVLLDSSLKIHGDVMCLKHLLMTTTSFQGKEFAQLLLPDERDGFAKFVQASQAQAPTVLEASTGAPGCLRVSFVGSHGIRVGADIFHVAVPHLFGGDEPYHLLAVKEDWDSRVQPEARAEDALPTFHSATGARSVSRRSLRSQASQSSRGASSTASSVLCDFPELSEATLLFDMGTPLFDITQMHLKFLRHNPHTEPNLDDEIHCSMPSLRRFIRPTDWQTFCGKVERYAQKQQDGPLAPKALPRLALRMPQDPRKYLIAGSAQLSAMSAKSLIAASSSARPPSQRHFWLHLKDFHPDETGRERHRSVLQEIEEAQH